MKPTDLTDEAGSKKNDKTVNVDAQLTKERLKMTKKSSCAGWWIGAW